MQMLLNRRFPVNYENNKEKFATHNILRDSRTELVKMGHTSTQNVTRIYRAGSLKITAI